MAVVSAEPDDLTKDLVLMLVCVRNMYTAATCNHPDDQVRVVVLDKSAELLLRAREAGYLLEKEIPTREQLQDRIELLEGVLRAVRSDRPTAHSDAVWQRINHALDSPR